MELELGHSRHWRQSKLPQYPLLLARPRSAHQASSASASRFLSRWYKIPAASSPCYSGRDVLPTRHSRLCRSQLFGSSVNSHRSITSYWNNFPLKALALALLSMSVNRARTAPCALSCDIAPIPVRGGSPVDEKLLPASRRRMPNRLKIRRNPRSVLPKNGFHAKEILLHPRDERPCQDT